MGERRTFAYPFLGSTLQIEFLQRPMHQLEGVGVALWPACCALSTFLLNRYGEAFFRGKRVIELGSGAGLLGIALAKLGAHVTFTDASFATAALELLKENVKSNLTLDDSEVAKRVQVFDWGTSLPAGLHAPFDMVVGADVVYHREAQPLLVEALRICADRDSMIFLAFQEHNIEAVEAFCELAPRYFDAVDVKPRKLRRLCGDHYRQDMHIVQLRVRAEGERARPLHMEFVRLAGLFDHSDESRDESTSDSDGEQL